MVSWNEPPRQVEPGDVGDLPDLLGSVEDGRDSALHGLMPSARQAGDPGVGDLQQLGQQSCGPVGSAECLARRPQGLGHDRAEAQFAGPSGTVTVSRTIPAAHLKPPAQHDLRRGARPDQLHDFSTLASN